MSDGLEHWAVTERQFLKEDIAWLEAGGKAISPSGDDITAQRLETLQLRLEHANKAIDEASSA